MPNTVYFENDKYKIRLTHKKKDGVASVPVNHVWTARCLPADAPDATLSIFDTAEILYHGTSLTAGSAMLAMTMIKAKLRPTVLDYDKFPSWLQQQLPEP